MTTSVADAGSRLADKVCIITGGARGQGAAEARLFAAQGGRVCVADVLDVQGTALAEDIGCTYHHMDVSREDQWHTLVEAVVAQFGRIDVLVNNAGIFRATRFVDTALEEFEKVMAVNSTGVFLGMRAVAPQMIAQGSGSIVNISSLAGMRGALGSFAYGASKWAVRGMTKTAALELARKGVRVNSIHPGLIDTPMVADLERGTDGLVRRTPLGRAAQPEEVARMALFLASDESSYSTGSEFLIDGGLNAL